MRGRAWEIAIYPFSFGEFLRHHGHEIPSAPSNLSEKKTAALDHHFARYLETGGFPEAQGLNPAHRRQLLQGFIDVLLLRDVIERHQVANVTALRWLVRRLLSSPAGLFPVTKFSADLKSQGIPVFDRSGKANTGHALESVVFTELQRRGAEIAYVKTASGFEVDFLARYPDGTEELIQVCRSIDDPDTRERETRALQDPSSEHPNAGQVILTMESRMPFPPVPTPINVSSAWKWMIS